MHEDHGVLYDALPSNLISLDTPCACCMPSALLTLLAGVFLAIYVVSAILKRLLPFSLGKTIVTYLGYLLHFIVLSLATFFGALMQSQRFRDWFFFQFALFVLAKDKPMDTVRCAHLQHLSGRVLELGPGPGTNFRCFKNTSSHHITEWVGVEPNPHFLPHLHKEHAKYNLSFPISTVWLTTGETVDIEPHSFDFVIGTHVLCSVRDTDAVLRQVARALKNETGEYRFFEHVAVDWDTDTDRDTRDTPSDKWWKYVLQVATQPVFYLVGNGCQFKRLWRNLRDTRLLQDMDLVSLRHTNVPIGVSFLEPHIVGVLRKK